MFLMLLFNFLEAEDSDLEFIYNENDFKSFENYCQSNYKRINQETELKLQKLIVFHRHGDRVPHIMAGTKWNNEVCKKCNLDKNNISNCATIQCKNGLLTKKGYNQMVSLGQFIKLNYPEINNKQIKTRCTEIERTQASLHGVFYGLTGELTVPDVRIDDLKKDALIIPTDCPLIEERIDSDIYSPFLPLQVEDKKLRSVPAKTRADQYFTTICNKVQIDCDIINCDYTIIKKYLEDSNESWSHEANILLRDELILRMTFGRFINDLKKMVNDKIALHIVSIHDRSLVVIMAGLGIKETEHPSYASAIFMEVWKNKNGDEFIRIIYNDKTCKTVIHDKCNIPKAKFMDYVDILKMDEKEMREQCKIQTFSKINN